MTLEAKKFQLIDWIVRLTDEATLDYIAQLQEHHNTTPDSKKISGIPLTTYKDIQKKRVNIELLKEEQNYHPLAPDELSAIAREAAIQEPIEKLLADLNHIR